MATLAKAVDDPSENATYEAVAASDIDSLEIFPPVGISRLGDSKKEYFFAPEVPGNINPPTLDGNFRDDEQNIRRQAARFRVYAYNAAGLLLGEVNSKNGYTLRWRVRVANKKGSFTKFRGRWRPDTQDRRNPDVDPTAALDQRLKLIVDPGEQTIVLNEGSQNVQLSGGFSGSKNSPTNVYLGELQVDKAGRLVYLGGRGYSQCVADAGKRQPEVISEFDSTDWVDDTSDGWVSVTVTAAGGFRKSSAHKATIVCAPAKFAWGVYTPTTLYDIMEDIYDQENNPNRSQEDVGEVKYYTHIYPVLLSAYTVSWTNNKAFEGHGPFSKGNFLSPELKNDLISTTPNSLKNEIFRRLREPDYQNRDQAIAVFMPRLSGDNGDMVEPGEISKDPDPIKSFAALTKLQYDRFRKWKDGHFTVVPPTTRLDKTKKVPSATPGDKIKEGGHITYLDDFGGFGDADDDDDFTAVPPATPRDKIKGDDLEDLDAELLELLEDPEFLEGLEETSSPEKIEDVPLLKQPESLTRAHLELTIGDPLYPGIEMWWLAKRHDTYDFSCTRNPPFRVNHERVLPGHLTRGLSLPWQADFDLCNTHWWPAVRPDIVVTKADYEATMNPAPGTKEQFAIATTTRQNWTRGLRDTSSDYISYPGSTDMVRFWSYLGFVKRYLAPNPEHTPEPPVYLESERRQLPEL